MVPQEDVKCENNLAAPKYATSHIPFVFLAKMLCQDQRFQAMPPHTAPSALLAPNVPVEHDPQFHSYGGASCWLNDPGQGGASDSAMPRGIAGPAISSTSDLHDSPPFFWKQPQTTEQATATSLACMQALYAPSLPPAPFQIITHTPGSPMHSDVCVNAGIYASNCCVKRPAMQAQNMQHGARVLGAWATLTRTRVASYDV